MRTQLERLRGYFISEGGIGVKGQIKKYRTTIRKGGETFLQMLMVRNYIRDGIIYRI